MLSLPLDVLGLILESDCLVHTPQFYFDESGAPAFRIPFTERAYMFYHDTPIGRILRGFDRGEATLELWKSRPRFTLSYSSTRVLELALTCTRFWRALKKVRAVREELFRDDFLIATLGDTAERYPYFPARFCSHNSEYLKEVVDTIQGSFNRCYVYLFLFISFAALVPFERTFRVDQKVSTVTLVSHTDFPRDGDGFLLFWDACQKVKTKEVHLTDVKQMVATVKQAGKLHLSVLVCVVPLGGWSEADKALAEQIKVKFFFVVSVDCSLFLKTFAASIGLTNHFDVRVASRCTGSEEEKNVDESVRAVVRAIRAANPGQTVLSKVKAKQKCILC